MEILLLGQAGLLICTPTVRLLCDPWFVGSAHLGSWLPWPSSPDLVEQQFELARQATHLFLSHAHEDHAHRETLEQIGSKPLILGNFAHEGLRQLAHEVGTSVTFLEDEESLRIGDVTVRIHLERPRYRTNSILVVESTEGRVVNANDCGLDPELLARIRAYGHPNVFLSTLNFVANGYPFPYLTGQEPDFLERVQQVRRQVVDGFRRGMQVLEPDLSIAFAGPVLMAHQMNDHLNALEDARDWSRMVAELSTDRHPVVSARPLMKLEVTNGGTYITSRGSSLNTCQQTVHAPEPSFSWQETDDRALERFAALLTDVAVQQQIDVRTALHLHISDTIEDVAARRANHRRALSFAPGSPYCRPWRTCDEEDPHLAIFVTASHWRAFQRTEVDYDSLLLSYLIRCSRRPDVFDAALHNLLRFGPDPGTRAALIAASTRPSEDSRESLRVEYLGRTYTVAARCPHEGALLDPQRVEQIDGEACLRCPLHQWAFRLRDGACVKGDPSKRLSIISTE